MSTHEELMQLRIQRMRELGEPTTIDEGRCGECKSYGAIGTTCDVCKRGVYVVEEAR